MATKSANKPSTGLLLKLRVAAKVLEETVLHPGKTSRIMVDRERGTVTVTRDSDKAP
jgi:hypothetical protein